MRRLAGSQKEILRILEAKLACQEQKAELLRGLIEALSSSTGKVESVFPAVHAAALKRLSGQQALLAVCKKEAEEIRGEVLAARGREKTLSEKATQFQREEQRKAQEEEGLESAVFMIAKACRKTDVLR
jgi:hypothetical protein